MEANEDEKLKLFQERYESCDRYLELKINSKDNCKEIEEERLRYMAKAREVSEKYSEQEYNKYILEQRVKVH